MRNKENKKEKFTETLIKILLITLVVVVITFSLICCGWSIYAFIKYGNTPVGEIPTWALWFMFRPR